MKCPFSCQLFSMAISEVGILLVLWYDLLSKVNSNQKAMFTQYCGIGESESSTLFEEQGTL